LSCHLFDFLILTGLTVFFFFASGCLCYIDLGPGLFFVIFSGAILIVISSIALFFSVYTGCMSLIWVSANQHFLISVGMTWHAFFFFYKFSTASRIEGTLARMLCRVGYLACSLNN